LLDRLVLTHPLTVTISSEGDNVKTWLIDRLIEINLYYFKWQAACAGAPIILQCHDTVNINTAVPMAKATIAVQKNAAKNASNNNKMQTMLVTKSWWCIIAWYVTTQISFIAHKQKGGSDEAEILCS